MFKIKQITVSGKWVISSTLVTETPASSNAVAVPPVELIVYLYWCNKFIRSKSRHEWN